MSNHSHHSRIVSFSVIDDNIQCNNDSMELNDENDSMLSNKGKDDFSSRFVTSRKLRQSLPAVKFNSNTITKQTIHIQTKTNKIPDEKTSHNKDIHRRQTFGFSKSNKQDENNNNSGVVSRYMYSHVCRLLSESHNALDAKTQDCQLAAQLGQQLINENNHLQEINTGLNNRINEQNQEIQTLHEMENNFKQQLENLSQQNLSMITQSNQAEIHNIHINNIDIDSSFSIAEFMKTELNNNNNNNNNNNYYEAHYYNNNNNNVNNNHTNSNNNNNNNNNDLNESLNDSQYLNNNNNNHNTNQYSGDLTTDFHRLQRKLIRERKNHELNIKAAEVQIQQLKQEKLELNEFIQSTHSQNKSNQYYIEKIKQQENNINLLQESLNELQFQYMAERKLLIQQQTKSNQLFNSQLKQDLDIQIQENNALKQQNSLLSENYEFSVQNSKQLNKQLEEANKTIQLLYDQLTNLKQTQNDSHTRINNPKDNNPSNTINDNSDNAGTNIEIENVTFLQNESDPEHEEKHEIRENDYELEGNQIDRMNLEESTPYIERSVSFMNQFEYNITTSINNDDNNPDSISYNNSNSNGLVSINLSWSINDNDNSLSSLDISRLTCIFELLSHQWRIALLLIDSNTQSNSNAWLPDTVSADCIHCHKKFNLLTRRHHCRLCGGLVCSECSNHRVNISKFGLASVRVCNLCYVICKTMDIKLNTGSSQISNANQLPLFPKINGGQINQAEIYKIDNNVSFNNSNNNNTSITILEPAQRLLLTDEQNHRRPQNNNKYKSSTDSSFQIVVI